MSKYQTIFRIAGDVSDEVSYHFDGPYFEHIAFIWGRFPDQFSPEAEATVEVRDPDDGRVVLTGAFEGGSDESHPGWRFWTLDAIEPEYYREIAFLSCD